VAVVLTLVQTKQIRINININLLHPITGVRMYLKKENLFWNIYSSVNW